MITVMIPVLIPVMHSCHICYVFLLWLPCNSDSIRLDFRWHEIKVYRWGFPCLDYSFDVLVSWDRNLSVYNQFCLWSVLLRISCFTIVTLYPFLYILYLCSNPPVFCTWLLYSPWLATWLLHPTRLGSFTDSPGFLCPGIGAYGFLRCWSE